MRSTLLKVDELLNVGRYPKMIVASSAKPERGLIVQRWPDDVHGHVRMERVLLHLALDHAHHRLERGHIGSVAVERVVAERTTLGAPADQISRARISGGGISHAFDRPAS